ncbi:methyltransferase domain-containing protein (plasmid) [Rhizobium sp. NIBRBAC000502774]|nr:methyltransferase domain-containing protein [Rhizobium sp. NIBRBAC000502774]
MICKTDVYGPVATEYTARPIYPRDLFAYLAAQCEQRVIAWDCGCGSGQASRGLLEHFDVVIATDPSSDQLSQAAPADSIEYRQAPAESSGLPSSSVDLVCAFMAAHWFDLGFPGPMVHAPLQASLLLRFLDEQYPRLSIRQFHFRPTRPLYHTSSFDLLCSEENGIFCMSIRSSDGLMTMSASCNVH